MIVRLTACVAACAALLTCPAIAQTTRSTTGQAALRGRQQPPRQLTSQQRQQSPLPRAARPPAPEPISPELQRVLAQWEAASQKIGRIQGFHQRRVYDMVFKVEKLSVGRFYHEVPDKGRIDIQPAKITPGMKSSRVDRKTQQPFKLVADQSEKWICDGKRLIDIDDLNKQAAIMPIPPRGQGENIMNGPLPFLFGMPAKTATQRYKLRLNPKGTNQKQIQLLAMPRWRQDSANWSQAQIILDRATYLPLFVQLIDPAGTKETVFSFKKIEVDRKGALGTRIKDIFWPDPFRPNLRPYKIHQQVAGNLSKPTITLKPGEVAVPDIIHASYKDAKDRLTNAGLIVNATVAKGGAAPNANLYHKVRDTRPRPYDVVKIGATVTLQIYNEMPKVAARQ